MDRNRCWSQGRERASTPNTDFFKIIELIIDVNIFIIIKLTTNANAAVSHEAICTIDDISCADISSEEVADRPNADARPIKRKPQVPVRHADR